MIPILTREQMGAVDAAAPEPVEELIDRAGRAVAREAMKVLVEEDMVKMSAENGAYFLERLQAVDSKHVKEIRGRGLWIAIELNDEAGGARRFCEALQEEGLLCKETHSTVIRVAPPLTIGREDIDWAVERIAKVLTTL